MDKACQPYKCGRLEVLHHHLVLLNFLRGAGWAGLPVGAAASTVAAVDPEVTLQPFSLNRWN
jgi:hypothetical protein